MNLLGGSFVLNCPVISYVVARPEVGSLRHFGVDRLRTDLRCLLMRQGSLSYVRLLMLC